MRTSGLFDLQVNGFAGVDFNDAALTPDGLDHALAAMLECGTTRCLPTIITAHPDELAQRFAALDRAVAASRFGRHMVPGYHLEGPFMSPLEGYRGCHPAAAMRAAEPALVERLDRSMQRKILMVTIAAEAENARPFTRWATANGKVVAIGHTAAGVEQIAAVVDDGAAVSTHLGNGIAHQQHKFANPMMAQLAEPRLAATFIADGIHIPGPVLAVLVRARTPERAILVTDAVAAAKAPPGSYRFAGMTIVRDANGRVTSGGDGYLAGSSLTLDDAVRNVAGWGITTPERAVDMASRFPEALMTRAFHAAGANVPTGDVDWNDDLTVRAAHIDGGPSFART